MKTEDIKRSVLRAKVFIRAAEEVLAERGDQPERQFPGTMLSGAVRRQSMELSRQLAKMRNPKNPWRKP